MEPSSEGFFSEYFGRLGDEARGELGRPAYECRPSTVWRFPAFTFGQGASNKLIFLYEIHNTDKPVKTNQYRSLHMVKLFRVISGEMHSYPELANSNVWVPLVNIARYMP